MKKLFTLLCFTALLLPCAFSEVTFGARGFTEWGVTSEIKNSDSNSNTSLDLLRSWDFGGSVFGRISFPAAKNVFVQPELGFQHTTTAMKDKVGNDTIRTSFSYNALILPVLIGYGFPINQNLTVHLEAGPQVSFVLGDISLKTTLPEEIDGTSSWTISAKPKNRVLFSAIIGGGASYNFSPAVALLGDLRYDLGFVKLTAKDKEKNEDGTTTTYGSIVPRGVSFSAGFLVRF